MIIKVRYVYIRKYEKLEVKRYKEEKNIIWLFGVGRFIWKWILLLGEKIKNKIIGLK